MKAWSWFFLSAFLAGPAAFAGGVDGGGGNTRPGRPITEADVREVLIKGRSMVIFLMNSYSQHATGKSPEPLPVKLFAGPVSMLERLRSVNVTLASKGPCFDDKGNAVDGSASQAKQTVCISLPRLLEKLNRESLRNQTLALVAHEYSHLVGTSEAEAEQLQDYVLETLLNRDAGEIYAAASAAQYALDDWVPYLAERRGKLSEVGWKKLDELLQNLHQAYNKLYASRGYFSLTDGFGDGFLLIEMMRVGFFRAETRWLGGDRSDISQDNHEMNERLFAQFGHPEIDGRMMILMLGGGTGDGKPEDLDPRFAEVTVGRVVDFPSASREFEKIYAFLSHLRTDLQRAMRPLAT